MLLLIIINSINNITFTFQFPVLPEDVKNSLSKDSRDLYELCLAVISGQCDSSVSARKLGKIILYRWLTFASHVLRYFIARVIIFIIERTVL